MVPATPCFTVYHPALSALPRQCEQHSQRQGEGAQPAPKQEVFIFSFPVPGVELAAPVPLCWLPEATRLTRITEGVCMWVVQSQRLWLWASREIAYVRDLQKHKVGGKEMEDLVLKVTAIYFFYTLSMFLTTSVLRIVHIFPQS